MNVTNVKMSKTFQITLTAVYAAMVFALQVVLGPIPNVELVTFMISFAAIVFPWRMSVSITLCFSVLEVLFYGYGQWVLLYLLIWPTLCIVTLLCKKAILKHWWIFIIINALFGFLFGTVDATLFYLVTGFNFPATIAYWLRGFVFDGIHGISNTAIATLLYLPVYNIWNTNFKRFIQNTRKEESYA